jgi:asparagine synthase (glutamine-hydrolysing)
MCGLVGYIESKNSANCSHDIDKAIASLEHRGPDASGKDEFHTNKKVGFGHRRLSILDISDAGNQPMESFTGRFKVIFNGEIYNHLEIREHIKNTYSFNSWKSSSDTETLVNLFEFIEFKEALKLIKGMFAIVLFDLRNNFIYFSRDRIGEKPLYLSFNESSILFGSELISLTKFSSFKKDISMNALSSFFKFNYIPAPQTIYKSTFKCLPGKFICIDLNKFTFDKTYDCFDDIFLNDGISINDYWSSLNLLEESMIETKDFNETSLNLESIISKAVKNQLISDMPIGAFLSGGIDSSLITALMQKESMDKVKTFTIGFEDKRYDESNYAKEVANHLGTSHTELILSQDDVINVIPNLSKIYSEPFADSSQIPTLLVSKLAKSEVSVALSGDGGDELFGGYNRYFLAPTVWSILKKFPFSFRSFSADIMLSSPNSLKSIENISRFLYKKTPVQLVEKIQSLSSKVKNIESEKDLFISLISGYEDLSELLNFKSDPQSYAYNDEIWSNTSLSFQEKMMFLDMITYLPDDIMCKVDRATMAFSLESRAPFLDQDVVEASYKIPTQYKIKNKNGKHILKNILHKYVPKDLIERPKQGFGIPLDEWIKGPLKNDFYESISDENLSHNLINPTVVKKMLDDHIDGKRNWQNQLWAIYSFQNWFHENEINS